MPQLTGVSVEGLVFDHFRLGIISLLLALLRSHLIFMNLLRTLLDALTHTYNRTSKMTTGNHEHCPCPIMVPVMLDILELREIRVRASSRVKY